MRIWKAPILIALVMCSGFQGQVLFGEDWTRRLVGNLNQINENVQRNVQQLNQQIQQQVQDQLAHISQLNQDLNGTIGDGFTNVSGNGGTVIVNGGKGTSRIINSGYTDDGQPFHRDIESRVVGNVLHYTERVYDPKTKTFNRTGYTLDLSDPNAVPVPLSKSQN